MRRPPLPDFEKPPLTEVALSMQFEGLDAFRSIHLGLLWIDLGQKRFPNFEEQPPVKALLEQSNPGPFENRVEFELLEMPPVPRYVFVSENGNEVVQVQQDRFTVNWRKRRSSDEYPRFEFVAEFFKQQVEVFSAFVRANNLGDLKVTQAEVTYVNSIDRSHGVGALDEVLSFFSGTFSDTFLSRPEEAFLSLRFPIERDEERIGRLYVDIRPEVRGGSPLPFKMVLAARGRPRSEGIIDAMEFFEIGRRYAVSGFASITSKEAQYSWGRRDDARLSE